MESLRGMPPQDNELEKKKLDFFVTNFEALGAHSKYIKTKPALNKKESTEEGQLESKVTAMDTNLNEWAEEKQKKMTNKEHELRKQLANQEQRFKEQIKSWKRDLDVSK